MKLHPPLVKTVSRTRTRNSFRKSSVKMAYLHLILALILIVCSKATGQVTVTPGAPGVVTVPSTTPVTVSPPANQASTPPANPVGVPGGGTSSGQKWCVAKVGAASDKLQAALDFACGSGGGVNCLAIQPSGVCFSPNTLQNHASYAFSSYFVNHPNMATSCDFGGTATITTTNPGSGACSYPTSLASPTTPSQVTPPVTTTTPTQYPPSTTTPYSSGLATPPSILGGFGGSPVTDTSSSSMLANPFVVLIGVAVLHI